MEIEYIKKISLKHMIDKCLTLFSKKSDIIDDCTSTDTERPLSANQGKELQKQITELNDNLNIATLSEVKEFLNIEGA